MSTALTLDIASPLDMIHFGKNLGRLLFPGAIVALIGQLGAGKTFLTRAIAEGLEIADSRVVNSPTFVLIQEYAARLPIYHFDAYRLVSSRDFADLGVEEYFSGGGVCLVEWADRVQDCLPRDHLRIEILPTGENSRQVELQARGERYKLILQALENFKSPPPSLTPPG